MDVSVTLQPERSQAELTITVPPSEFTPYLERAAKKLSKEKPVAGFRPGKASLTVAVEAFGKDRVVSTALDAAVPHLFVRAITDHDIQAINRPRVTIQEAGIDTPLRLTAVVDILPRVTLGDVTKLAVQKRSVTVRDEEVEKELTRLAKMRSTYLDVARPAQRGDTVTVDFRVTVDGAPLEGGESKNHPVHLGEKHFVPGFEEGLLGVRAGDDKTFAVTFPPDFATSALREKTAAIQVHVHAVQQRVIPQLTDAFATQLGTFNSLAHLKAELTKNITLEREHAETERFRLELTDQLVKGAAFGTLPPILIEKEVDRRIEEFRQMLSLQRTTLDDYLARRTTTLQQFREGLRASAEQSVKRALALRAFADREHITVHDDEVNAEIQRYLARFSSPTANHDAASLREHFINVLRDRTALERLERLAAGS